MRAYKSYAMKRYGKEGFTLVELMIVVAIIGILAALAIYGVRRYMASAKTSEAKNSVGAISRAAAAAYERENLPNELLGEGKTSATASQALCTSAVAVPGTVPVGTKYQPNSATGNDFETGDNLAGWKCLRFSINQPIYYQYQYNAASNYVGPPKGAPALGADSFEAAAVGDLDGDGVTSVFTRSGDVNTTTKTVKVATTVFEFEPYE